MPERHIRICGGRENNLKELNHRIFEAGADAVMIGNYLVTLGSNLNDDLNMIQKQGLTF